jgi:hypothetical protein
MQLQGTGKQSLSSTWTALGSESSAPQLEKSNPSAQERINELFWRRCSPPPWDSSSSFSPGTPDRRINYLLASLSEMDLLPPSMLYPSRRVGDSAAALSHSPGPPLSLSRHHTAAEMHPRTVATVL